MGGKFQTNLNANVTHLVCGVCASSEKYFVCRVMCSFVLNVSLNFFLGRSGKWHSSDDARMDSKCSDSLGAEVSMLESTFITLFSSSDRFKCPLFYKFIISLSGFSEKDRSTIKQYVEREGLRHLPFLQCDCGIYSGATYSPSLIKDQCTHLICKEPKGTFRSCSTRLQWARPNSRRHEVWPCSEMGYSRS
jgi:hypothetical protein